MYINSIGHYIPKERISNSYFIYVNGLTDEWIEKRTGISTRARASEEEDCHTMGIMALRDAVKRVTYKPSEVDLIISVGYSPLDTVGTLAHVIQKEINAQEAKAFYASSACSSFINGLEIAECYFAAGKATKAIIVCSEHNSVYSNESDPTSGHLWGDAAVCMFLSAKKISKNDPQINHIHTAGLGHIGKGPNGVYLRPRKDGIRMPDGKDVFINACTYMPLAINKILDSSRLNINNIDKIICHQANIRIVENIRKEMKLSEDVFLNNIKDLGNTGSASSALVLSQNYHNFKEGEKVILTVFGGGYSCGSTLVEF